MAQMGLSAEFEMFIVSPIRELGRGSISSLVVLGSKSGRFMNLQSHWFNVPISPIRRDQISSPGVLGSEAGRFERLLSYWYGTDAPESQSQQMFELAYPGN